MVVTQCASSRLVIRLGSSTTTVSPSRYAVTVLRRRGLRTTLTSGFAEAAAGRSGRGVDLGIVATSIPCSRDHTRASRAVPSDHAPHPPASAPWTMRPTRLLRLPARAGRGAGFRAGTLRRLSARNFFFVHKLAASDRLVTGLIEFSDSTSCPQPRAGCPQTPSP